MRAVEERVRDGVRQRRRSDGEARHEPSIRLVSALGTARVSLTASRSTFTPQIQRTGRIVTTDDLERDQVLAQRLRLFSWIREDHLDIPSGESVQGFFAFAEQGVFPPAFASRASYDLDFSGRAKQGQPLQGAARQAHLHPQLLQGHLRAHSARACG